jgi:ribose transport system permease protein
MNTTVAESKMFDDSLIMRKSIFRKFIHARELGVLIALLIMCVIMSIASPYFLKTINIFNVMRNMSTIGIIAIGMSMVIITGGIDLSVGSVMALAGMITARMLYSGLPTLIALLIGFAVGILVGAINGFMISRLNVTPFIVTLGMLSIARGLTVFFATGIKGVGVASNIKINNQFVEFIGGGYIGPIPVPVIIMFVLVFAFSYFLNNTALGRHIYAIGSNEEAARLTGVNVNHVKIFVYTLVGMLCALAGIISCGLLSTAATNIGTGTELDVVAAVVIGGASLKGGKGSIAGSIFGAAIMAVLRNSFVLLKMPGYMQTISIGVVIVLAVTLDTIRIKKK